MPVIAPSQSSTNPQSINAISPRDTSAGITGGIVVAILALSMAYAVGLYFLYRYSRDHPKPMNKVESVTLQKYFPRKSISKLCYPPFPSYPQSSLCYSRIASRAVLYLFFIVTNIVEVSFCCSWLRLRMLPVGGYLNKQALTPIHRFITFLHFVPFHDPPDHLICSHR